MADFYDARGNTYFVASPEEIGQFAEIPRTAAEAAMSRGQWAVRAIERICGRLQRNRRSLRARDSYRMDY